MTTITHATIDILPDIFPLMEEYLLSPFCGTHAEFNEEHKKTLLKDFGAEKYKALIACEGEKVAGFAIYFDSYSTSLAKPCLFLHDLYITEKQRKKGIGKLFFDELKKIATEQNCGRLEWNVNTSNQNGVNFYNHIGGERTDEFLYHLSISP